MKSPLKVETENYSTHNAAIAVAERTERCSAPIKLRHHSRACGLEISVAILSAESVADVAG
jgi:hypothetical protein